MGISVVGFVAVAAERGLELRKELETEYGIEDEKDDTQASGIGSRGGEAVS